MAQSTPAEKKTAQQTQEQQSRLQPLRGLLSFIRRLFNSDQHIIGIDVGSSYIKILQLRRSKEGYLVKNCLTRALPQPAKDNPAEKRRLAAEFIREYFSEAHIRNSQGRVSVCGKGVFVFFLSVPILSKKDLRSAVAIELKKRLPFQLDINSVVFDFYVNGQSRDEKGVSLQVTCIAVDRFTIDDQVQFLKEIDVQPVGLYVIPDALGNLVSHCFKLPVEKVLVILEMGASVSLLNFYKGKNLVFSREVPIGGEHLTQALAKTVSGPEGSITISLEEAEKLKRNCGIPVAEEAQAEFLTDYGALRGEQILTMLRPALERLVLEISRTLTYYSKTFKTQAIEELHLTGGASRIRNLEKFLQFNLEGIKKVDHLNILKIVKGWVDKGILKQELVMEQAAPHLAVAFGLAMGIGAKVNLLPKKEKIEQKLSIVTTMVRVVFPAILLLNIAFYGWTYANALGYRKMISQLAYQISQMQASTSQVRQYLEIKGRLEERKGLLEQARGKQPLWEGVLKELSIVTPQEITLVRLEPAPMKQAKGIRIVGKATSRYVLVDLVLTQYVTTLEDSPFFSDVKLVSAEKDMYDPVPSQRFEIVCTLSY